jgi:hypothetical protein
MGIYKVKAYIEYEIEAEDSDEAIARLGECIVQDLDEGDITTIAEVSAERVGDGEISKSDGD